MSDSAQSFPQALPPRLERIPLRAGPLTLSFEAGGLRYVKFGDHEVLRRVYAAVRDRHWGTVPAEISNLQTELSGRAFRITCTSTHRQNEIHFVWQAEIVGTTDGTVAFTFDGEAKSTFLRNRIGFCVLHPTACADTRCRVERADGAREELVFPRLLAATQPVPGMMDLKSLAHEVVPGAWAELQFEGDLFEMEDQRNWLDASYKTFCTPLRIPRPVLIEAGTRVRQRVRLRLKGIETIELPAAASSTRSSDPEFHNPVSITLTTDRKPLPALGLGFASHGQPFTTREVELLARLRLRHLRADAKLATAGWSAQLRLANDQARDLNTPLELAVHLPRAGGERELAELTRQLQALKSAVARVLVFREGEETASAGSHALARSHLAFLRSPIGAGTDCDFQQLNRTRPLDSAADFIHWSMNPQVHAFDLQSLAETPTAIPAQLQSASAFFPGKPLVISPVTLKPRFNPEAIGPAPLPPSGELPPQVDPRQLTPFAAAWTLAVIKQLAESGAASLTLFETTGWRGVMERESGSPLPDKFRSQPGQLFPLYHVVGAVNSLVRGEVIATRSNDPFRVESLALAEKDRAWVWLANLTGEPQTALVTGFTCATRQHKLDWSLARERTSAPQPLWCERGSELFPAVPREIELKLDPFGLVRLELEL